MRERDAILISERELAAMTADLDEMHRAAGGPTRRAFLAGSGLALGGLAVAACSSSSSGKSLTTQRSATHDLDVAGLAAALENLAVATYQAGIDAANKGKLGKVPPAVTTFAKTAQSQHKQHAAAWNAIRAGEHKAAVTRSDATLKRAVVDPALKSLHDVAGFAKLALQLEEIAAATYVAAIDQLSGRGSVKTAASIQPVEMQHAAILHFLLGEYPVPASFASTTGARDTSDSTS